MPDLWAFIKFDMLRNVLKAIKIFLIFIITIIAENR